MLLNIRSLTALSVDEQSDWTPAPVTVTRIGQRRDYADDEMMFAWGMAMSEVRTATVSQEGGADAHVFGSGASQTASPSLRPAPALLDASSPVITKGKHVLTRATSQIRPLPPVPPSRSMASSQYPS